MNGTAFSTGCPYHGGPSDIAGEKSVIDWLNGRVRGEDAGGRPMRADRHDGTSAMIGKSYDGTSLTSGIRPGGRRRDRRPEPLLGERDYLPRVGHVKAAVFVVHGFQEDNVRLNQLSRWWRGLKDHGVQRKLWLMRVGHTDPFDARRAAWVDTLHRWFDHFLYGVDNGIDRGPTVTIEDAKDTWRDYPDWPFLAATGWTSYLSATTASAAGTLADGPGGSTRTLTFTDPATATSVPDETTITDPTGSQAWRRVFLSAPLKSDLRLSGTPIVALRAALSRAQSNLGAIIVDYGPGTQVTRANEGIANTQTPHLLGHVL